MKFPVWIRGQLLRWLCSEIWILRWLASSEDDSLEELPSSSGSLWSFSPSAVLPGDSCSVPVSSVLASSATASVDGCERFFSLFRSIPAKERPVTATPTPSLTNVKEFPSVKRLHCWPIGNSFSY
ncbi:hypothetical protein Q3G72_007322 [Acer saccharum]|nr:hypothetical protein Q3G72_007322 [Acer saccharum]